MLSGEWIVRCQSRCGEPSRCLLKKIQERDGISDSKLTSEDGEHNSKKYLGDQLYSLGDDCTVGVKNSSRVSAWVKYIGGSAINERGM